MKIGWPAAPPASRWSPPAPTSSPRAPASPAPARRPAAPRAASGVTQRGPRLEGLYGSQVKLADGRTVVADDNYIRESILNPTAKVVAGYDPVMPTFQGQVTEEQLSQLMAYVRSLGPEGSAPAGGRGGPSTAAPGAPTAAVGG